jgi:hypothetical protein
MATFDPEEWVEVGEMCCDRIPGISGEALLRTALNRAYYAVLMCVKQRIEQAHGKGAVPRFQTHAAILRAVHSGEASSKTSGTGCKPCRYAVRRQTTSCVQHRCRGAWSIPMCASAVI